MPNFTIGCIQMDGWMDDYMYIHVDNFIFYLSIYLSNLTWSGNMHTNYKTGCLWERKKEK